MVGVWPFPSEQEEGTGCFPVSSHPSSSENSFKELVDPGGQGGRSVGWGERVGNSALSCTDDDAGVTAVFDPP